MSDAVSLKDYERLPDKSWLTHEGRHFNYLIHGKEHFLVSPHSFASKQTFFEIEQYQGDYYLHFYPDVDSLKRKNDERDDGWGPIDPNDDYDNAGVNLHARDLSHAQILSEIAIEHFDELFEIHSSDKIIDVLSNNEDFRSTVTVALIAHKKDMSVDEYQKHIEDIFSKHAPQQQDETQIKPEPAPPLDRQIETANKAGYVQGVCESVLAFNTDDNRKIMSESAMTMLSKKLLSEMNVTQDMAKKYANPQTYKALEQSIFAPKQEQAINRPRRWG